MIFNRKKMVLKMIRKIPAFSLIEMTIVLIIIGLISGFAFPTLKVALDNQKIKVTEQNFEKILYALASYANQNKSLPNAADPQNRTGKEDKASNRRRGILPYADLGIPESIAKDGYQRWFTYIVDDYYAAVSPLMIHRSASQANQNRLCDNLIPPNPLKIRGLQENVAIAIISHGPQGRGAYPNPQASPPLGADEQQNSTSDQEIIDRPISLDPTHTFSHSVVWVTSRNLLSIYGHAPCPPIREDISISGGTRYEIPRYTD
jgi:type II secretory pathway pseudopilin PulG